MPSKKPFAVLVERDLTLKDQKARSTSALKIRIGIPRWTRRGKEAACPVAVEGLVGRVADICGVDPMHALELAIAFTNVLITNLPPHKKVHWPNGEPYEADGATAK